MTKAEIYDETQNWCSIQLIILKQILFEIRCMWKKKTLGLVHLTFLLIKKCMHACGYSSKRKCEKIIYLYIFLSKILCREILLQEWIRKLLSPEVVSIEDSQWISPGEKHRTKTAVPIRNIFL